MKPIYPPCSNTIAIFNLLGYAKLYEALKGHITIEQQSVRHIRPNPTNHFDAEEYQDIIEFWYFIENPNSKISWCKTIHGKPLEKVYIKDSQGLPYVIDLLPKELAIQFWKEVAKGHELNIQSIERTMQQIQQKNRDLISYRKIKTALYKETLKHINKIEKNGKSKL